MNFAMKKKPINIFIIDDNPKDIDIIRNVLENKENNVFLHQVGNDAEVSSFIKSRGLYRDMPPPDLIFLELNMNCMDGREILVTLQKNDGLAFIPLIVLTTSQDEKDILNAYQLNANCYIIKPSCPDHFKRTIEFIEDFWITHAKLPPEA